MARYEYGLLGCDYLCGIIQIRLFVRPSSKILLYPRTGYLGRPDLGVNPLNTKLAINKQDSGSNLTQNSGNWTLDVNAVKEICRHRKN